MTLEELSNAELIEEFKQAVEDLPGSGARGRSRYYDAKEELEERLSEECPEADEEETQFFCESTRRNYF